MQLLLDLPLPTLGLDDFIVGANAALLHELTAMLAHGRSDGALYVWGQPGCGKTHLLQAAVAAALGRGLLAGYIDCAVQSLHDGLAQHEWLALDNVQNLGEDEQFQLFGLFNRFREQGHVLLVAGSAPAARLPLRPDLTTRLGWGLSYELQPLSEVDTIEALCRHARRRGFELPPEVARYLLVHLPRDMHTLATALATIDRASLSQHRTITLPLVRQALDQRA